MDTLRPWLRALGVGLLGLGGLAFLALAPMTAGTSLLIAVPLLLLPNWLARYDLAAAQQTSAGGFVAVAGGAAFIVWVLVALVSAD
jgi:hypothetical protein